MTDAELTAALLAWYRTARRDLPWRDCRDPYRIWVSEVMLQQTQVATVIPYYQRFVARFPTLAELARASLTDVLTLWQGLGYYQRARHLLAAAQLLCAHHDGHLPTDATALRELPGFGEYTAAAVASLAWGQPVVAIDGNVNRVMARLLALDGDPRVGAHRRVLRARLEPLLPHEAAADFNQALMELGATVCTPRQPQCQNCPWAPACQALASGEPTAWPHRRARPADRERTHACAVISRHGLTLLARRAEGGRWAGLWELPRVEVDGGEDPAESLRRGLAGSLGLSVQVGAPLAGLRHQVSGERIRLTAYAATVDEAPPQLRGYVEVRWVADWSGLPLGAWQRRLLERVAPRG